MAQRQGTHEGHPYINHPDRPGSAGIKGGSRSGVGASLVGALRVDVRLRLRW